MFLNRRKLESLSRRQFLRGGVVGIGAANVAPSLGRKVFADTADGLVQVPKVAQPAYLASYVDPVFRSKSPESRATWYRHV